MKRLRSVLDLVFKDERGAVIILVALLLVFVLIGMAALTVDVGYLYLQRRHLQTTADAAALAAAWELPWANPDITSTALEYAEHNHIVPDGNDTVIVVSDPYGDRRKVKVEITDKYPLFFALAPPIRETDADVYAMAVATKVMPGLDILPFFVIDYSFLGDEYRFYDYPTNTQPYYKVDCACFNPGQDNEYDRVNTTPLGQYGDWANDIDELYNLLKNNSTVTTWHLSGSSGQFGLANMEDFLDMNKIDQNIKGSKTKLLNYILTYGLDEEFCDDSNNNNRFGYSGDVRAINNNPPQGLITVSDRLERDGYKGYIVLVLPSRAIELQGQSDAAFYSGEFLIGYCNPLTVEGGNQPYLLGTLVDVVKHCSEWDESTEHGRVALIE